MKSCDRLVRVVVSSLEPAEPGSAIEAHLRGVLDALNKSDTLDVVDVIAERRAAGMRRLWQLLHLSMRASWHLMAVDVGYLRWHPLGILTTVACSVSRTPYILEVNGSLDDITTAHPRSKWLKQGLKLATAHQFRHAAAIITVTPGLASWVRLVAGRDDTNVLVMANGAPLDITQHRCSPAQPRYAVFVGQLTAWQGITTLIDATQSPHWPKALQLKIVGDGQLYQQLVARASPHFELAGRLPRAEARSLMAEASVSVSPQGEPTGRNRYGVSPIKVSESLLLGVPVAVSALNVSATDITRRNMGAVHQPDDHHDLARAVARAAAIAEHPAHRNRISHDARLTYTWEAVGRRTETLIHTVVSGVPQHVREP